MSILQIGPYTIDSIETGSFALDGGAMFGVVPKTLWAKTNPADDQNRIEMRARAMLIRRKADAQGPARNILVDCGMGHKWATKFAEIYKVDFTRWNLDQELKAHGLTREDITDYIATHLHFDHAGGLTYRENPVDPKSELRPTFPNATVYVQRRNWELAWNPTEKDRASYLKENFEIYSDSARIGRKLVLLDTPSTDPSGVTRHGSPDSKEEEILPGIKVEVSNGHTLGMQIVRVAWDSPNNAPPKSIIYCADLIPTQTHVRVPFIMGYDNYPMFILMEKKKLLHRAVDEGSYLFYEHCPHTIASQVKRTEKGDFEATKHLFQAPT